MSFRSSRYMFSPAQFPPSISTLSIQEQYITISFIFPAAFRSPVIRRSPETLTPASTTASEPTPPAHSRAITVPVRSSRPQPHLTDQLESTHLHPAPVTRRRLRPAPTEPRPFSSTLNSNQPLLTGWLLIITTQIPYDLKLKTLNVGDTNEIIQIQGFFKDEGVLNKRAQGVGFPLISHFFAIANVFVRYFVIMYIVIPVSYWGLNVDNAKNFPIYSPLLLMVKNIIYRPSWTVDLSWMEISYRASSKGKIMVLLAVCVFLKKVIQMPFWALLPVALLAFSFTLPVSIITATTNQTPGLNISTEYLMGIIYPGRPIANVCFKVYGYMSMSQAIAFLSDFSSLVIT
ncbi:oligopeptide transporter [Striga asiatica]|uniref:Oligopeptide transporter n=1 Tax=Striga asiatica TaxID=4170 RepID=A0A5A7QR51_STRAF|nr:oligopeptide transporter [Striga asiatica]